MKMRHAIWAATCCLIVGGYAVTAHGSDASPHPLTREDLRWVDRVTFGANSGTVARYQELGRARFLEEQLHPPSDDPSDLAADIHALMVSRKSAADLMREARQQQQRVQEITNPDEKASARKALNEQRREATYETAERQFMRDLYSPWQLREQMTWFWMNHFNVFSGKGAVALALPDYENRAVRPHALGHFRDLVLATLESPAMLVYLDNAQSAVGKINENYARELMELHTLGVSGGPSGSRYTQQDVQELARVLTGVGLNQAEIAGRDGAFEFNPNRHDFGTKTVLNEKIEGRGFDEVEKAIALLCRQPATARFISTQLATYFVADDPPRRLVDAMATTFDHTDGDIAAVLKTMFTSPDFAAALDHSDPGVGKFKDPVQFVLSSLRLAYDGKRITNYRPIMNWMQQLAEPPYGRVTPDGYPLTESSWTSSGQMVKRFEIARIIGSGNARLFDVADGTPVRAGFPMLTSKLFYDAIEPTLSPRTRAALDQTTSQPEWNTVLLSSPEWMER
jgi:uncharacterized protein (DUF1800 family)